MKYTVQVKIYNRFDKNKGEINKDLSSAAPSIDTVLIGRVSKHLSFSEAVTVAEIKEEVAKLFKNKNLMEVKLSDKGVELENSALVESASLLYEATTGIALGDVPAEEASVDGVRQAAKKAERSAAIEAAKLAGNDAKKATVSIDPKLVLAEKWNEYKSKFIN